MAEGYKAWSGGQVLDATDLTDYTSSQAVMRFASAAARDAALTTGVVKEGMLAYLKDTNILTVNTTGATSGWVQIYPVPTDALVDGSVTNAKLGASSVNSSNIVNGTIVGADIASNTITPSNMTNGTYTLTATNSQLLNNYSQNENATGSSILLRTTTGDIRTNYRLFCDMVANNYLVFADGVGTFGTLFRVEYRGVYDSPAISGRTVLVNSSGTIGTSVSSERYKEEITPATIDAGAVLQLEPVTFRYKVEALEEGAERPLEFGLIAEQAAELGLEEILFRDSDDRPQAIAYEKLGVLLLAVVKDQDRRIAELERRLEEMGA